LSTGVRAWAFVLWAVVLVERPIGAHADASATALSARALFGAKASRPIRYMELARALEKAQLPADELDRLIDRLDVRMQRRLMAGRLSPLEIFTAAARPVRTTQTKVDVQILGAGAAGLTVGQALRARGVGVEVIEKADRTGGRTLTDSAGRDHGAMWLHHTGGEGAERNPLYPIAKARGFSLVADDRGKQLVWDGKQLKSGDAFESAAVAMDEKMVAVGEHRDVAGSEVIKPRGRLQRAVANWTAQTMYGVDHLDQVPTGDWSVEVPEEGDYFITEGLGRFVKSFSHGLTINLGAPATHVKWNDAGAEITVGDKKVYAKKLVLTMPPSVLARGAITFEPPLPAWKQRAFESVPMGHFTKVMLDFKTNVFGALPPNSRIFDISDPDQPFEFLIRPSGSNQVVMEVGGERAKDIVAMGDEGATKLALDRLRQMYGDAIARESKGGIVVKEWKG
jgi:monoamine oxidase